MSTAELSKKNAQNLSKGPEIHENQQNSHELPNLHYSHTPQIISTESSESESKKPSAEA